MHDHDVEGHVEEQDGPLATILFETASGDGPAEKCVLAVHEDVWEVTRPDGPYWTTLRSEAKRLGEAG